LEFYSKTFPESLVALDMNRIKWHGSAIKVSSMATKVANGHCVRCQLLLPMMLKELRENNVKGVLFQEKVCERVPIFKI